MKFFLLLAAFVLLNLNAVDYAALLRRQEGEILPELIHPNLLRNPDFSDSLRFWTGNVRRRGGTPARRFCLILPRNRRAFFISKFTGTFRNWDSGDWKSGKSG